MKTAEEPSPTEAGPPPSVPLWALAGAALAGGACAAMAAAGWLSAVAAAIVSPAAAFAVVALAIRLGRRQASAGAARELERLCGQLGRILQEKDFTARVESSDPAPGIRSLARACDELVLQVQLGNQELGKLRDQLEERVAARTVELTRLAEEMRAARDRAEKGDLAKSQFLASMSHEIRTPMNGVIGMAELVLKSDLSAQQRDCISTIRGSAEALLTILNDVLDFCKMEAGKLELFPESFHLRQGIGACFDTIALAAEAKGLDLAFRVDPDVQDELVGDAGRLRQVLVNLLGNAVKFTDAGEVLLDVTTASRAPGLLELHFMVTDTGVGIPAEKQGAIFNPFEQADGSSTRRHDGTGLGLSIVRQLVELMGGTIWLESDRQRGSAFHFTARFGLQARPKDESARSPLELAGLRVLVVDNHARTRAIALELLAGWNAVGEEATGAREGLEKLESARAAGEPFSVALVDSMMPGEDGFWLVSQTRLRPKLAVAAVMMLPQTHRFDSAARSQELGAWATVAKPIGRDGLRMALLAALGMDLSDKSAAAETAAADAAAVPRLKILLAEDNPVNQKLALMLLRERGHEVCVADDGEAAVELARRQRFDAILMDVSMPKMSGLEATARIRELEAGTGIHVPIIAVTAHALKRDREMCLSAGMDEYLTKPLRVSDLYAVVEGRKPAGRPEPIEEPASPRPPEAQDFDLRPMLERCNGNIRMVQAIVDEYLENCPAFLSDIRSAFEEGDADALRRAAHRLKGTLGIFSVASAFEAALKTEKLAKAGDIARAGLAVATLEEEVRSVTRYLENIDWTRFEARPVEVRAGEA